MDNLQPQRVFIVCTDDETATTVRDCLKRVAATLSAIDVFFDGTCDLDEDADDFIMKFTPIYSRFAATLMALYPNDEQILADASSLGDFGVRKINI